MNDEKIKIDPMDYYFDDLNKYPSMPHNKLKFALSRVKSCTEALIRALASSPLSWPFYVEEWRDVVHSGKQAHKMSKLTGKTQHENNLISNRIMKNMHIVEQNIGVLVPVDAPYLVRNAIEDCHFNMAVHYKVQEQIRGLEPTQGAWITNFLDGMKAQIIQVNSEIAEANLKLVIKFAKEYQHVGVPLSDLIQEGNIGLMRAIEKFDMSKGLKFTTYAVWWIKQGFLKVIKQNNRLIRIPTHIQESLSRISKSREAFLEKEGYEPSMVYLAEQEGMTEEELETLYNVCMDPISIETVVAGEQSKQLKDFIPDTTVDLEADLDAQSLRDEINKALDSFLTSTEKEVIIHRYGLFGQTVHTLEEIATKMDKSRERIRQLENAAKEKLAGCAVNLKEYL